MKNTKKLLALVLAMMMALSVMAMTAAAYDAEEHVHECAECYVDEGMEPDVKCPWCNGAAEYYGTNADLTGVHYIYVCLNGCGRFEL